MCGRNQASPSWCPSVFLRNLATLPILPSLLCRVFAELRKCKCTWCPNGSVSTRQKSREKLAESTPLYPLHVFVEKYTLFAFTCYAAVSPPNLHVFQSAARADTWRQNRDAHEATQTETSMYELVTEIQNTRKSMHILTG